MKTKTVVIYKFDITGKIIMMISSFVLQICVVLFSLISLAEIPSIT